MSTISTHLVIFSLLFGGTGATILAAQSSLPNQPLYGLKLASADVRADLPTGNRTQLDLAMDFADLRLQEALQLAAEGKPIPATLWELMENHLNLGLYTATGLNDEQLHQQLLQMQSRLETAMQRSAQLKSDSRYGNANDHIQAILQSKYQLVSNGLMDPTAFRQYMQSDQRHSGWQQSAPARPAPSSSSTRQPKVIPNQTHNNPSQNGHCQNCGQWNGSGSSGQRGGGSGGHNGGGWHH